MNAQSEKKLADQPKKRPRRAFRAVVLIFSFFAILGSGAVLWIMDRPLQAPPWLQTRIENRIVANSGGMQISFGVMELTVQQGWRPSVRLLDVEFRSEEGKPILAVSELQTALAMRPLMRGNVQPKRIALNGLFATLRRSADGQLELQTSDTPDSRTRQAANLPALVGQIDEIFQRPAMSALTSIEVDAVTLRFEDARAKRAWTIDGARARVSREGQDVDLAADFAVLGGSASVALVEANYASQIGSPEAQFGVTVTDMPAADVAAFNPAFGWLAGVDAPISGALRSGVSTDGALAPISATLSIDQGHLQPNAETRPIPFDSAQVYFTFSPEDASLTFDQVAVDSPWVKGQAEGQAQLRGLEEGRLDELVGQFQLSGLHLNPPDVFDQPVFFEGAELDFRFQPAPFRFDLGQMRIVDQDTSLLVDGWLEAAQDGWHVAVNAHLDEITPEHLLRLWPEELATKTRVWVSENILEAKLTEIEAALRSEPTEKPDVYLSFGFDEATVRFMKTMPPVTEGKGVASILRNRFVVAVEQGIVTAPQGGRIDLSGSSYIIPDLRVKGGPPSIVRLRTDSTVTGLLSLLDRPPLNVMSRADLSPDVADGRATMQATIAVPMRKGLTVEDVTYDVSGVLSTVSSKKLVKDHKLDARELKVVASQDGLTFSGDARFDGIPADVTFAQTFGRPEVATSKVIATVEVTPDAVAQLDLGLPPGAVRGAGTGELRLDFKRGEDPDFEFISDLVGVGLRIPELGWSKSEKSEAKLEVAGSLGPVPRVDRLELSAPGLNAAGTVSLREEGGLDTASFTRVRVGGWLDAPVILTGRGQGAAPAVSVSGGTLDLREAEFGSGGSGSGQSGPLSVAVNRLQITDTIALSGFRGDFRTSRGLEGTFRAKVNGGADVAGTVVPQSGRSAFKLQSENAGGVFASAGLLKQARGGKMNLILQPVGTAGAFNGSLTIKNTRIQDAPAIASLFNALSVVGLIEQMGGAGLHFAEVQAAFRLTPDRVTLTKASAVGPSIGLSMDGIYDVNQGHMDMQGVFSPIYLINGVGSVLTRRGEGLIGFNFRLKGPSDDPTVQVNPLSAFTPSIFREIFRRPPPKVQAEPGEEPGDAPRLNDADRQSADRERIESLAEDR